MNSQGCKYGVITYNSINIGDEIQSVAASRFLPQIDEYVYREQINNFIPKNKTLTKLIMNAWWMWKPENFLPSKWIEPLLISMYVRPPIRSEFLTPVVRNYLISKGPVGCRDMSTYEWLQKESIPSYFSGCLTLTLQRNYNIPRKDYILCVDADKTVVDKIRTLTNRPVYSMSRMLSPYYNSKQRMTVAKLVLRAYHDAALVVSPRLHVILPSLAMETPVLRIISDRGKYVGEQGRYMGYEEFLNSVNTDIGLEELENYDFNNPQPNPTKHFAMRNALIQKCAEFTGYNNTESLITNDIDPLVELLALNKNKQSQINRVCYWSSSENLEKVLKLKNKGIDQYNLIGNSVMEPMNISKLYFKYYRYKILARIYPGKAKREYYSKKLEKITSYLEIYLYNKLHYENISSIDNSKNRMSGTERISGGG